MVKIKVKGCLMETIVRMFISAGKRLLPDKWGVVATSLLIGGSVSLSAQSIPAFPGAEGFGTKTPGGRGGKVYLVTNLNDSGPGSLREGCEASGPRTVIFRTGGTIDLKDSITITSPFLTIAGQTAPGGGIAIKCTAEESVIKVQTHDVIIRYLRIRKGPGGGQDNLTLSTTAYNVVVDHCSISWGTDENINTYRDVHDVTFSWNIIAEPLHCSTHPEGCHGKNGAMGKYETGSQSFHHNLLMSAHDRSLKVNQAYGFAEYVNNVHYNNYDTTNFNGEYIGADPRGKSVGVNFIGNYYERGPNSTYQGKTLPEARIGKGSTNVFKLFAKGNIGPSRPSDTQPEWDIVSSSSAGHQVSTPFATPGITATSAAVAYEQVLNGAGATLPLRDAVDTRLVWEVRNKKGQWLDNPSQVGGYPVLAQGTVPADSDSDGMPDAWETARGLNPNSNDSAADRNGDGYTNLEEYINGLTGSTTSPPPSDTQAPTAPQGLKVTGTTQTSVSLSWNASSDNVGVAKYRVFRNGSAISDPTGTSFTDSGRTAATTYQYQVAAIDAAGNVSGKSAIVSATTQSATTPPPTDTQAPSVPQNLKVTGTAQTSVNLSWDASTDNVGVVKYQVFRNGASIATPTGTSFTDNGLTAATTYQYQVAALDAAGNASAKSGVVSATTQSGTTPPPTEEVIHRLQDGLFPNSKYTGTRDAFISSEKPDTVLGTLETVEIDGSPATAGLLKWYLKLPEGTKVLSAEITLNIVNSSRHDYHLYRAKRWWLEGSATWNLRYTDHPWAIPGAESEKDTDTLVLGTISARSLGSYTFPLNAGGVAQVQRWVDFPQENHGFVVLPAEGTTDGVDFSSKANSNPNLRPKLTIKYRK
jgi:pectate lyase